MNQSSQIVRVRFAPSPTGPLHIGSARTALFNYLFAKQHNGNFVLRIEDTDVKRSQKQYEKDILEQLKWLGIVWDEGPDMPQNKLKETYGPYRQSERTESHKRYLNKLLEAGFVFWCPHSKEELEAERKEQAQSREAPRHICGARDSDSRQTPHGMHAGEGRGVLRFKVPLDKKITFYDLIRGEISFNGELLGDFTIAKDLENPLYNFAVVVDDAEMKISHIIRGEDHISNTPKQILIWEALFKEAPPQYAHLPLILGPDRSKLSKRHGTMLIREYREEGYLPEALINFMALLGWNPGTEKEIFSVDELVKIFSISRVQKSGAIFNKERLDWMNAQYIAKLNPEQLLEYTKPYLEKYGKQDAVFAKKIIALERPRMKRLSEITTLADFFFRDPVYEKELLVWRNSDLDSAKKNLQRAAEIISKIPERDFKQKDKMRSILLSEARAHGDRGEFLWPLRAALSGKSASPDPIDIIDILGKTKTLERIRSAIAKMA